MTHPLTDKIIREELITRDKYDRRLRDGIANCYKENMRAAADWQLEQCIAWLNDTDCDDPQETAQRLREAMRPTQEDNS